MALAARYKKAIYVTLALFSLAGLAYAARYFAYRAEVGYTAVLLTDSGPKSLGPVESDGIRIKPINARVKLVTEKLLFESVPNLLLRTTDGKTCHIDEMQFQFRFDDPEQAATRFRLPAKRRIIDSAPTFISYVERLMQERYSADELDAIANMDNFVERFKDRDFTQLFETFGIAMERAKITGPVNCSV